MATAMASEMKDVCVFLLNQTGIIVQVPANQDHLRSITACEIVDQIKGEVRRGSRLFQCKSRGGNGVNHTHAQNESINYAHAQNECINSDEDLNDFFSLFIVSPLLELQLLPSHQPFRLLSCWNGILSQYGCVKRECILSDVPILSYQRNIFLKRHEECVIEDPIILELLYEEAKVRILTGQYPYPEYESLASIQAAVDLGPFQPRIHCASYFKIKDTIYLPLHYRQRIHKYKDRGERQRIHKYSDRGERHGCYNHSDQGVMGCLGGLFRTTSGGGNGGKVHPPPSASRLFHNNPQRSHSSTNQDIDSGYIHNNPQRSHSSTNQDTDSPRAQSSSPYVRITELFKSIYEDAHPSRIELIRSYLSRCWTLPFYGSAFFIGQIESLCESRIKKILTPSLDKQIYVGVNWEGIHLIDKNNPFHLMSLSFDEFKWQLGHPHHTNLDGTTRNDPHLIQCLFIQITVKERGKESEGKECKIFQIFSKSSPLIASLIKHFSSHAQLTDVPDSGSFREDLVTNTKPVEKSMIGPLERICSASFNAKGECIKLQGSISVLT